MQEYPGQLYIDADVQPPNWNDVNWKAAPLPFKLYHNCAFIPCAYEAMGEPDDSAEDNLRRAQIGQILADIYGFTRQYHIINDQKMIQLKSAQQQLLNVKKMHSLTFSTGLLR